MANKPIFILSAPRSCSSVFSAMLGQHPELYGVPELYLCMGDTVGEILNRIDSTLYIEGLIRVIAQVAFGGQSVPQTLAAIHWLLEHQETNPMDIFDALQRDVGRPFVEKSPGVSYFPAMLAKYPKDAHFVHLVRGLKGWVPSVIEWLDWQTDWVKEMHQDLFSVHQNCNANIREFLKDVPSQITIQAEDLLTHPEATLKRVCQAFSLDVSAESIEAMMHPENSPYSCVGTCFAPYGADPTFLKSPAFRRSNASVSN